MLIVLDLDETLVHASKEGGNFDVQPAFEIYGYKVYPRPLLENFLIRLHQHFELGIWSSAGDEYVQEVVSRILPRGVKPAFVWGASRCTIRRDYELNIYVNTKKLKKLKKHGYSLEKTLMVDDSPEKLYQNYGNGIIIEPFWGDPTDRELAYLFSYLMEIEKAENVRRIEKRYWRQETYPLFSL